MARNLLPYMPALHDDIGWRTHNRFGDGRAVRGSCTLIARDSSQANQMIGFAWFDDALYVDSDVDEPWWCVNAIAVDPLQRGRGAGRALVAEIEFLARRAGVAMLYGQSVPDAVTFWHSQNYSVHREDETLTAHPYAVLRDGRRVRATFSPGPGDRFFTKVIAFEPGSVRSLLLAESVLKRITGG